jgi:YfiH family protein
MTLRIPEDVLIPDWPAPRKVRAFMTTRAGGASEGPYASFNLGLHVNDTVESVESNREQLLAAAPGKPLWLNQVHGTEVVAAHSSAPGPTADAAWTNQPGVVCSVLVADCLPVVLADRAGTVVGVAHAGWRGLAGGVIENTVKAMGNPTSELVVWLGAAIGPEAFEVGQDVHDAFVAHDVEASVAFRRRANGKYLADLYTLARQRLNAMGVYAVFGGGHCTFTEADRFFSFRRDKTTGRMAALVWIAEGGA